MKKLLTLVLVLGLASVASAIPMIGFQPYDAADMDAVVGDKGEAPGTYAIDILAMDLTGTAGWLKSTGELTIVCSGGVSFGNVDNLDYQGEGDTNMFWNVGILDDVLAVLDDTTHARVGAATTSTNTMFMLNLDDAPIENILVVWDGTPGTVEIVPSAQAGPFGVASWYDGATAGDDFEATGGMVEFIPEPLTMTLLGLGGLALIRRRR